MKINSLKELEAVIKLCRRTGVHTINIDGVSLELGSEPTKTPKRVKYEDEPLSAGMITADIKIPRAITKAATDINTPELTPEQLLFYSSDPSVIEELNKEA